MSNRVPIPVGIIGLGRSGWSIHAMAIKQQTDRFKVQAVYDPLEERREQAHTELGCTTHSSLEALLADDAVELVVVAPPNGFHAEYAVKALGAGKHVLCEKPFGLTTADVDKMIGAAESAGRVLQPFQQRRYEPDFQKVKEICESGLLGKIQLIRICWHSFKRRWDWQTSKQFFGGQLNNNGPHPIDHAMALFGGEDPMVACEMRNVLYSGDAEDFLKVTISGPGRPTVEVELIDNIAYPQERWFVAGSAGGLHGTAQSLEWKWVDWTTMPERRLSLDPTPDRSYNSEELDWHTDSWEALSASDSGAGAAPASAPVLALYGNLYDVIRNGAKQEITPQEVRSRVLVMERARAASEARGWKA